MATFEQSRDDLSQYMPENSPYDLMKPVEFEEASALERVTSLPLVASTWDTVMAYYISAKKSHPYVTPYLELAEKLTTTAASVALATTKPLVGRVAPTVNSYANRGLDKLEDALPMIHDQPDEIYDSTKAAVTSLVSSKIDFALSTTEKYVDYYMPPLEDEEVDSSAEEDSDDDSDASTFTEDAEPASPKDRIRVISAKVRERAYRRAMDRVHGVHKRSTETLNKLRFTVDLIQYAKENLDATRGRVLSTVATANETLRHGVAASRDNVANVWKEIKDRTNETKFLLPSELHVLERAQMLTQRLQKSCSTLLSIITNLPQYDSLRSQALRAKESADALAHSLANKASIEELSASLTASARVQIENLGRMLDNLFEVLSEHAPLNWLAPDFDYDPLEGLRMQDLEVDLRMHDNNPVNDALPRGESRNQVRYRRG